MFDSQKKKLFIHIVQFFFFFEKQQQRYRSNIVKKKGQSFTVIVTSRVLRLLSLLAMVRTLLFRTRCCQFCWATLRVIERSRATNRRTFAFQLNFCRGSATATKSLASNNSTENVFTLYLRTLLLRFACQLNRSVASKTSNQIEICQSLHHSKFSLQQNVYFRVW